MNIKQLDIKQTFFASEWKKIALCIAALMTLNLLLYMNTVHYDFLKDDFRLIVENPRIQDFKTFTHTIGSKFFAFPDYPYLHYWRPMSLFSFYTDFQLWGLNPYGYHLFNIILNALNALLIFLIFYTVFKKILVAFFASLFFSIHPSHVEAVSWVSGRTDLLGAFFIFSAILLFILFLKKKKPLLYIGAAFLFILALLSKENAVLFPLLATGLIIADSTEKTMLKKRILAYTLPLWALDFIYIVLHNRFSGLRDVVSNFSPNDIFVIIKTIGAYTKIVLAPFFPTFHFSMHKFDRGTLEFAAYFAAALLILVFIIVKREKYKASLFSLLFLLFLLPVLDPEIVPSYPKIVIRFAYIPAVFAGIFFIETLGLFENKRLKRIFAVVLALIALIWIVESYTFQDYFKDKYSHYNGLIAYDSEDSSLLLPFALIKAQEGDYENSLILVNRVLDVNPNDRWLDVSDMAGLLKANLLVVSGEPDKGKSLAEKLLGETRKDEMKYYGYVILAKYYEKKGDYSMALVMLGKAGKIGETGDLLFQTAIIYAKMGNTKEAFRCLEKARELNPSDPRYKKLGGLLPPSLYH